MSFRSTLFHSAVIFIAVTAVLPSSGSADIAFTTGSNGSPFFIDQSGQTVQKFSQSLSGVLDMAFDPSSSMLYTLHTNGNIYRTSESGQVDLVFHGHSMIANGHIAANEGKIAFTTSSAGHPFTIDENGHAIGGYGQAAEGVLDLEFDSVSGDLFTLQTNGMIIRRTAGNMLEPIYRSLGGFGPGHISAYGGKIAFTTSQQGTTFIINESGTLIGGYGQGFEGVLDMEFDQESGDLFTLHISGAIYRCSEDDQIDLVYRSFGGFGPGHLTMLELQTTTIVEPMGFQVTRGQYLSGSAQSLAASDDQHLVARRSSSSIQSSVFFEAEGMNSVAVPQSVSLTVEASVLARSPVTQFVDVFNFSTGVFEQIDSRPASRFADASFEIDLIGNLAEYLEPVTNHVRTRLRFQSANPRQNFTANVDQIIWSIAE